MSFSTLAEPVRLPCCGAEDFGVPDAEDDFLGLSIQLKFLALSIRLVHGKIIYKKCQLFLPSSGAHNMKSKKTI